MNKTTFDVDVEGYFYVESEPDLWKARDWAKATVSARVIQTGVGAYGALDGRFGTTYFDVGDVLIKLGPPLNTIIVSKLALDTFETEATTEQ